MIWYIAMEKYFIIYMICNFNREVVDIGNFMIDILNWTMNKHNSGLNTENMIYKTKDELEVIQFLILE